MAASETTPKGHPEADETPKDTAVRETFEETGLYIELRQLGPSVDYIYQQPIDGVMQCKQIVLFPLQVHTKEVRLQLSEVKTHAWATYDVVIALINLPAIRRCMQQTTLILSQMVPDDKM